MAAQPSLTKTPTNVCILRVVAHMIVKKQDIHQHPFVDSNMVVEQLKGPMIEINKTYSSIGL